MIIWLALFITPPRSCEGIVTYEHYYLLSIQHKNVEVESPRFVAYTSQISWLDKMWVFEANSDVQTTK